MSRICSMSSSAISASASEGKNAGVFHVKHSIRLLTPADGPTLEPFLAGHAESSMFLRGNLQARGIGTATAPEGNYFGAFRGDDLVGVGSHSWTGMVLVQAPEHADELAVAAVEASGRRAA